MCSWDISVDEGFLVKLHITDLAIVGEAGQCGKDKLIVTDSQQSLGKMRLWKNKGTMACYLPFLGEISK